MASSILPQLASKPLIYCERFHLHITSFFDTFFPMALFLRTKPNGLSRTNSNSREDLVYITRSYIRDALITVFMCCALAHLWQPANHRWLLIIFFFCIADSHWQLLCVNLLLASDIDKEVSGKNTLESLIIKLGNFKHLKHFFAFNVFLPAVRWKKVSVKKKKKMPEAPAGLLFQKSNIMG